MVVVMFVEVSIHFHSLACLLLLLPRAHRFSVYIDLEIHCTLCRSAPYTSTTITTATTANLYRNPKRPQRYQARGEEGTGYLD